MLTLVCARKPFSKIIMAKKTKKKNSKPDEKIVIDEAKGLIFSDEKEIYNHFLPQIEALEKEYEKIALDSEPEGVTFTKHEFYLTQVLQDPEEVWVSTEVFPDVPIGMFMGKYKLDDDESTSGDGTAKSIEFHYIALTYFVRDVPKFVFLHFPVFDPAVVEKYKRGIKIFDRATGGATQYEETVDALSEGDEFAVGLYQAMLKLRSNKDIPEEEFSRYLVHREKTIEEPDEVWKFTDSQGHVIVRFIKQIMDEDGAVYIVTTLEEEASESQYLLFSFPTTDQNLVDRFRQGESLEAVSYTREESH